MMNPRTNHEIHLEAIGNLNNPDSFERMLLLSPEEVLRFTNETAHAECSSECCFECKNNISNMQIKCPFCSSMIQVWRLTFAVTHLEDEKVIIDALETWASTGEPLIHTLIHVPESY